MLLTESLGILDLRKLSHGRVRVVETKKQAILRYFLQALKTLQRNLPSLLSQSNSILQIRRGMPKIWSTSPTRRGAQTMIYHTTLSTSPIRRYAQMMLSMSPNVQQRKKVGKVKSVYIASMYLGVNESIVNLYLGQIQELSVQ